MKKIFNFFWTKILLILWILCWLEFVLFLLTFPYCLFVGWTWDQDLYDFQTYFCTIPWPVVVITLIALFLITVCFYLIKKINFSKVRYKNILISTLLIISSFYTVSFWRNTSYEISSRTGYDEQRIQCPEEYSGQNAECIGVNPQKSLFLKMSGFLWYPFLWIKNEHIIFDISSTGMLFIIFSLYIKFLQKMAKNSK